MSGVRQEIVQQGIGASEIAAALGLNPYKSPLELWLEKTGQRPGFAGNDRTEWGLDVEPALREWYVRRAQVPVWVPSVSLFHAGHAWMRSTPDGIAIDPAGAAIPFGNPGSESWRHGFEAKNVGWRSAHRWGEPGTDELPIEYLLQAQQGMAVTGLDRWDVVASLGGAPPEVYQVRRDDDLIAEIVVGGEHFMRLVEAGEPPEIDGSAAWADYLAERYPHAVEDFVEADEALELAVDRLRLTRQARAQIEEEEARLVNEIKAAIGPRSGVQSKQGRLTWRQAKPRELVDWQGIARHVAGYAHLPDEVVARAIEEHTRQGKPTRPFNCPRSWATKND